MKINSLEPKILTLDLGLKTGWAFYNGDGMYASGNVNFSTKRFEGSGMRYVLFRKWLDSILRDVKFISEVYFEEVVKHSGTAPSHVYGGFMATITSWCEENKIPYQSVPVKTIKKYVTGNGNASKQMVIDALNEKGYEVQDDNEADALAIMVYIGEKNDE